MVKRINSFLSYFDLFLPSYCTCRGLYLHVITHYDTLNRNPLDEGSARHTKPYPTTRNIHNRQTSMLLRKSNPQPGNRGAADPQLKVTNKTAEVLGFRLTNQLNNRMISCLINLSRARLTVYNWPNYGFPNCAPQGTAYFRGKHRSSDCRRALHLLWWMRGDSY
jgi:hypothetical protein